MALLIKNNAYSILSATLELIGTSLIVKAGHGDRFPIAAGDDYFKLTLQDTANNIEIVKVLARAASSDSMTVERAQEGTTARDWNINDLVELRLTQGALAPLQLLEEASTVAEIQTRLNVPTRTGGNASGNWAINAATATALQNSRTINGVPFDGTQNISIGANTTNSLTVNNSGAGVAPGTAFNGSAARTISYNSVGAPSVTGANASGTWPISVTGNASTVTNGVYNNGGTYGISISGNAASATNATNAVNATNASMSVTAGNADTVDGYHASPGIVGNTCVVRNASGHVVTNYLSATDDGNPGTGTNITSFIAKRGDDLYRSVSPLNAANTIRSVANGNWAINVTGNAATSTVAGSCTGNAGSASVLQSARVINGSLFNGGSNITTELWGATRNISLSGAISGSVNMNGASNVNISTAFTVKPTPVPEVALFTANGSFTVPAGVTKIAVTVVGGGGGGSQGSTGSSGTGEMVTTFDVPGGVGGAGGVAHGVYAVTPGQIIPIVVGVGGAGSNVGNGAAGNSSSFGVLASATGGGGGFVGGAGGTPGVGAGGNVRNLTGGFIDLFPYVYASSSRASGSTSAIAFDPSVGNIGAGMRGVGRPTPNTGTAIGGVGGAVIVEY